MMTTPAMASSMEVESLPVSQESTRELKMQSPAYYIPLSMRVEETSTRPASHAYIRYFNSDSVHCVNRIFMSDYLLAGAISALDMLGVSDDTYVLQVNYKKVYREGRVVSGGDTQLFITGTVENYEEDNSLGAMISELKEETRFSPINDSEMKMIGTISPDTKTKIDWFSCPISKMMYIGCIKQRPTRRLPYKYKVASIVHGTETEMYKALSSFESSRIPGNDDISGLVAMRIGDVRKAARIITSNASAGKSKKFTLYL